MAWKDTYAELGAEVQAAKTAAIAAFMAAPAESAIGAAAAVPPVLSRQQRAAAGIPLSSSDRSKVLTVTWRAISQAQLKHIGPVSSDGSILISQQDDGDGVPQLNLRAREQEPVPGSGGPQYVTDVNWNLRDAADQTVYDDGSLVLGGYTGTVVNFGRSQAFEVQNGAGLYIRANTNASNNYMGELTAPTAYWALPRFYPHFLHSRWREVWVLFMARPITPPVVEYNGFDVGVAVMTDIWGFNAINRAAITGQFVSPSYRGGGIGVTLAGTTTRIVGQVEDPDAHDVFAFRLMGHTEVQMFRGVSVGGDFPPLSDLEPLGWGLMQNGGVFLQQENTVLYVSAYGANSTGNADVLLERVKVMHLDPVASGSVPIPVDTRPARSEATIDSDVVTVPNRARAGTVIVSGAMTIDGVDITGSGFVDGDEFELILSGTGSVTLTHNAAGLAAGVVPFYVPPPTGGDAQDLELTLSGSTPLRNVVLRYLENEGFALVSGGMLS